MPVGRRVAGCRLNVLSLVILIGFCLALGVTACSPATTTSSLVIPSSTSSSATTQRTPTTSPPQPTTSEAFTTTTTAPVSTTASSDAQASTTGLYPAPTDGKWGYIDNTGTFIITPQFDSAERFWDGLAAVTVKGEVGYIDKTGASVIKPKYEKGGRFSEGLAAVVVNGRVGFIDRTGALAIAAKFYDDGRVTSFSFSRGLFPASLDGKKWGYIDKTGRWALQPQYAGARGFSESLAGASDGHWGFIDQTGTWVIQPQFLAVGEFSEGVAPAAGREGDATHPHTLTGFIDKKADWAIEPKYVKAQPFSEGLAAVVVTPAFDSPASYIDHAGKAADLGAYSAVDSFIDGLAVVRFGVGFYYMDKTGARIFHAQLKPQYVKSHHPCYTLAPVPLLQSPRSRELLSISHEAFFFSGLPGTPKAPCSLLGSCVARWVRMRAPSR